MLKGKRKLGIILLGILTLVLSACGGTVTKQEDVMKELQKISTEIESYHLEAELVVDHEGMPQNYYVEVWFKTPELYKVALKNENKEVSQIIIKNNDGVHVINPYMNKVFKFSKDWPHAKGQLYLYQTLLNNVLEAENLEYEYKEGMYHFAYEVQNGQYTAKQEVVLQEGFYPKMSYMTDESETVKITVNFENFEANLPLEDTEFNVEEQMKTGVLEPMDATATMAQDKSWTPLQPEYVPSGLTLKSLKIVEEGNSEYAVLQYAGNDANFTLIQKPFSEGFKDNNSQLIELYGKVAMLTSGANPTLQWYDQGLEFTLSGNVSVEEMERIASTVYRPAVK
ncbi:hypothetical protein BHU72_06995 [Desulfuribacillus stibiiarsenatis]|uniref:DUF4367 domain-containing protein n=1 Tax=Desulfuribacillus stibiiarsenatis TaxID=1390249 RepID=A0A1E5L479_9FIRM|nr:DUF4367 domain-containing protein [Desulfuribacillus stibiiarsenatis]OEH84932.1 hypothetical protein BHU72_06995 [Desulfuribacillus stibiiarsenatis]